ncbi:transposase (plasmid) [Nostoc sp. UHCC 0926]|uniref:transposase n=1 Tax=Nostoc sp. UHCC 0926 TaxID=3025190 RepID=UPI002362F18F|nr:transposase [Nostoc sp. UHCC 0926]WDD37067.1 transposase [Nostoc sp. UHCC 0926]
MDKQFHLKCCRESVRKTLKDLGFSWKKARKLLNNANTQKRAQTVKEALSVLQINLELLPGYSPDFMPVEHLWQWLRENVTYHTCYQSSTELIERVHLFEQDINSNPFEISVGVARRRHRLWVKNHLEEDEEKLRVST